MTRSTIPSAGRLQWLRKFWVATVRPVERHNADQAAQSSTAVPTGLPSRVLLCQLGCLQWTPRGTLVEGVHPEGNISAAQVRHSQSSARGWHIAPVVVCRRQQRNHVAGK